MIRALCLVVLVSAGLDPVEVAERHEQAGRPHLALHLLNALTAGSGDQAAQAARARLEERIQKSGARPSPRPASASPAGSPPAPGVPAGSPPLAARPPPLAARPTLSPSPAGPDPLPLWRAKKYMDAAPVFRRRLEASPHDYPTFTYLVMCYFKESERRLNAGDTDGARKAYEEGRRTERMYRPNFPEQTQSQAPDGLVREFGAQ